MILRIPIYPISCIIVITTNRNDSTNNKHIIINEIV